MTEVYHQSADNTDTGQNDWVTPTRLFKNLHRKYRFTLDPCCTAETAKCKQFFTAEDNGLIQSWQGHTVFMNPPYGDQAAAWIKKAYEEGQKPYTRVVVLVAARTDVKWWHEYVWRARRVFLLEGRVKFLRPPGHPDSGKESSAGFPSAVVEFYPGKYHPLFWPMTRHGIPIER